jgi:hypothetical protein
LFALSRSSSTSTLGRHLDAYVKYVKFNNKKKQKTLTFDPSEMGAVRSLSIFSFNKKKAKELAVHMVLFCEYPFNMIEHELFNKFMRACMLH